MSEHEPGSTWKVYERQWVIVFASDTRSKDAPEVQCQRRFDADFAGKVASGDAQVAPAVDKESSRLPWHLRLRLWTLVAEYKGYPGTEHPGAMTDGGKLVRGGSKEERELLDYGKKRLSHEG